MSQLDEGSPKSIAQEDSELLHLSVQVMLYLVANVLCIRCFLAHSKESIPAACMA